VNEMGRIYDSKDLGWEERENTLNIISDMKKRLEDEIAEQKRKGDLLTEARYSNVLGVLWNAKEVEVLLESLGKEFPGIGKYVKEIEEIVGTAEEIVNSYKITVNKNG